MKNFNGRMQDVYINRPFAEALDIVMKETVYLDDREVSVDVDQLRRILGHLEAEAEATIQPETFADDADTLRELKYNVRRFQDEQKQWFGKILLLCSALRAAKE